MGRNTWALIKLKKNFNVNVYRRGLIFLICSLVLNVVFGIFITNIYIHEPERDYYSTDGMTPPIKLTALAAPNMTSSALLDPDPVITEADKFIPQ